MKKMMFTLAMVMGLGTTVAFADKAKTRENTSCYEVTQMDDNYTPIDLDDLPEEVVASIAENFPGSTPKSAAVSTDEETQTVTYKVTLEYEEGSEQTVLLSDKGDVLQ